MSSFKNAAGYLFWSKPFVKTTLYFLTIHFNWNFLFMLKFYTAPTISSLASTSTSTSGMHCRYCLLFRATGKQGICCFSDINSLRSAFMNSGVEVKWLGWDPMFLDMLCISHLCTVQNELPQLASVLNHRHFVWRFGSFLEHEAKACVLAVVPLTFVRDIDSTNDILEIRWV